MQLKISPEKLDTMIKHVREDQALPKALLPTFLALFLHTICYVFTAVCYYADIGSEVFYYNIFSACIEALSQSYIMYAFSIAWMLQDIRESTLGGKEQEPMFHVYTQIMSALLFVVLLVANALLVGPGAIVFKRVYTVYFAVRMLTYVVCNVGISYGIYIHSQQRYLAGFSRSIFESFIFIAVEYLLSIIGLRNMLPQIIRQCAITVFNVLWMFYMMTTKPFLDVIYKKKAERLDRQQFMLIKTRDFWKAAAYVACYGGLLAVVLGSFSLVIILCFFVFYRDTGLLSDSLRLFVLQMSCGLMNIAPLSLIQTVFPQLQLRLCKNQNDIAMNKLIRMIVISSATTILLFGILLPKAAYAFLTHNNVDSVFSYDVYKKTVFNAVAISLLEQLSLLAACITCAMETKGPLAILAFSRVSTAVVAVVAARLIIGKRVSPFLILFPFELANSLISVVIIIGSGIIIKHMREI